MPVSVRATLTVMRTVTEPMLQPLRQTLPEVNILTPAQPQIPVTVISTVTMMLMEPMLQPLRQTLAEARLGIPVLPASLKIGAAINN